MTKVIFENPGYRVVFHGERQQTIHSTRRLAEAELRVLRRKLCKSIVREGDDHWIH